MTPAEIAAARALCEAATKGPWRHEPRTVRDVIYDGSGRELLFTYQADIDEDTHPDLEGTDAAFIAGARTLLPAALDALESARRDYIALDGVLAEALRQRDEARADASKAIELLKLVIGDNGPQEQDIYERFGKLTGHRMPCAVEDCFLCRTLREDFPDGHEVDCG